MNKWNIVLTPEFGTEFKEIYEYISNKLLVPETAKKQCKRILNNVESLNDMPFRFPLVEREPWHTRGLRKLNVDNFIIFYYTNEQKNEVVVFHIFYGGRNIDKLI